MVQYNVIKKNFTSFFIGIRENKPDEIPINSMMEDENKEISLISPINKRTKLMRIDEIIAAGKPKNVAAKMIGM